MLKKLRFMLVVVFCLIAAGVNAQTTTASMRGKVTDVQHEVIIGATIKAIHVPSGTVYGAVTNVDGIFNLFGLRTGGPYKVEVSYVGYQPAMFEGIILSLGESYNLNVILKESSELLDEVIVVGSRDAKFQSQRTGAAQNFNAKAIENAPTMSRSIYDIARMTPQANLSNNGNGFSIAGTNGRYNSFQIDGTVNNDVFGLGSGTNGSQSGANPISLDAIEELQVVVAPFDVRQSGFTGGGINAVTKSGNNRFYASAYTYFNNENMVGTTPGKNIDNREKLTDQSKTTWGVSLGGPIIKNKLFYYVNYERVKETYPSSYTIGDGSLIDKSIADQVIGKIESLTGGYNAGGYGVRDINTESHKLMARMDWNINNAHKLTVRYNLLDARKLNYSNGSYALRLNDNGYWMNNKTHSIVAELHSRFSDVVYNEFRFGWTRVRDLRETDGMALPYVRINNIPYTSADGKTNTNGSITFGTENYSGANQLDQDIFTLSDNVTLNYGSHSITMGTHNEFYKMGNLFITNATGNYAYNSLADFLSIGTADEALPYQYQYSYSKEDLTGTKRWMPKFGAAQLGFYVQDEWQATDNLKLTYGVRMDMPIYFDKPSANETFNNSEIAKKYDVATNRMPKSLPLWAPRVGFRWNLDAERKALLRGGIGIFTGRVPFVWISNSFSNTGVEMAQYSIKNGDKYSPIPDDFKFNIDPAKQFDPAQSGAKAQTSTVCVMDRDFKMPQVLRANLAFEYRLPYNVRATIEGIWSKTLNNVYYQNIQYELKEGADGKPMTVDNMGDQRPYYGSVDNNYYGIYYLSNTSKGYTATASAKLEKSFDFGLNLMAAYTFTRSMSLNDGNSSQAASNWGKNTEVNPNAPSLQHTTYDIPHRVIASVGYSKKYAKYFATSVNLFYNGQSGERYNLIYDKDLNGDGYANDAIYIPTDAELTQMNFVDIKDKAGNITTTADAQRAAFGEWINERPEIAKSKGGYINRNQLNWKWENHFDLHLAQDFYIPIGKHTHTIQLNFDILNVANLLNRGWGTYHNVSWQYSALKVTSTASKTNKPTFNWGGGSEPNSISDYNSRWRMQVGVKYIF